MRSFDPDQPGDAAWEFRHRTDGLVTLRREITRRYEGRPLEQVLPGEPVQDKTGACYRIRTETRGALGRWRREHALADLLASTCLVRGIRDRTGRRLAQDGFRSLADLEEHPRFGAESRRLRALVEQGRTVELADVLGRRLPRSHPLCLRLAGLHDDRDFLFLDIETMGLFAGQPVIVAGLCRPAPDNTIRIEQYLCRDFPDEPALLAAVSAAVASCRVLVTFNGKAFDVPFLQGRCAYYGHPFPEIGLHLDLLHFCRRTWREELDSYDLGTIEHAILGTSRESDLPGELVPQFYYDFLRTGNAGFLKPIVEHNRQDVASLVNVLTELVLRWRDRA